MPKIIPDFNDSIGFTPSCTYTEWCTLFDLEQTAATFDEYLDQVEQELQDYIYDQQQNLRERIEF